MPIDGRRPFTEIFEVAQNELVREKAIGEEAKYKGYVNQIYTNELPSVLPEKKQKKDAFITLAADVTDGTVTVGSGTSLIQGASTSWSSASSDDFNIKVDGFDMVYRVTFSADTLLTSKDSLTWFEATGTGLSYVLYQDRYQPATDFAYMVSDNPEDPNVVYTVQNGQRIYLTPWTNEEFDRHANQQVSCPPSHYTVKWVSQLPYIYIWPAQDEADIMGYTYVPVFTGLRELVTGTATVTTGTAVVIGTNASLITGAVNTARTLYFRVDDDGTGSNSVWNKISTVNTGSTLTLNAVYAGTASGAAVNYTISEISEYPERFDDAILYKAAYLGDPDGVDSPKWLNEFASNVNQDITIESKRKRGHQLKNFPGMR